MKDIFDREINVGDVVVYMISAHERHFEEAVVTNVSDKHVTVEYTGLGCTNRAWRDLKQKGNRSKTKDSRSKLILLQSFETFLKNPSSVP